MQIAEIKQECEFVEYGNVCDSQGLYEKALDAYDRALRIFPDDADALFDKGETLVKMGRPQEATTTSRRRCRLTSARRIGMWRMARERAVSPLSSIWRCRPPAAAGTVAVPMISSRSGCADMAGLPMLRGIGNRALPPPDKFFS